MKVLITGAAGRIGRILASALELNHELVLGDIAPIDDPRYVLLDVTDPATVHDGMRGCEAVVHLAILDWPESDPHTALGYAPAAIRVHAVGTHHVLGAALEKGLTRVVHISSVSAVDGLPADVKAGSGTRHYSNSIYGMTKGFGEDICRMFYERFQLSVAVLRLGNVYIPDQGGAWMGNIFIPAGERGQALLQAPSRVHVDDVICAISRALEVTQPCHALVHIVGADSGNRWDLEAARRVYGWSPRYAFGPDGLPWAVC